MAAPNVWVTIFKGVRDVTPVKIMPLDKFLRQLNWNAEKGDAIRELARTKPGAYKAKKRNLYGFVLGKLNRRQAEGIREYSPVIALEIDTIPEEHVGHYLELVAGWPYCLAVWLSPSGLGLRILTRTDNENINDHETAFEQAAAALSEHTGIPLGKGTKEDPVHIDTATKDPARFWFYTGTNVYYGDSRVFNVVDHSHKNKKGANESAPNINKNGAKHTPETLARVEALCAALEKKGVDITEGYENWLAVGFACTALGELGKHYFFRISSQSEQFEAAETLKQWEACQKSDSLAKAKKAGLGTLFHLAKEKGIEIPAFVRKGKPADVPPLLLPRPALEWTREAQLRPTPKRLFGSFWFEQELTFLFGDTGTGKSILAVQIADAISRGRSVKGFSNQAPAQKVLLLDFELSDKQFQTRYTSEHGKLYPFHSNFYRTELEAGELPEAVSFEQALSANIERCVAEHDFTVILIDNVTFLGDELEEGRAALPLMKRLKALKKEHGLSILLLGHVTKRDASRPLSVNDLAGSKALSNFADSTFAIGFSQRHEGLRYLKQIKARAVEKEHDAENVVELRMAKPDNFTHFELCGYSEEREHLKGRSTEEEEMLLEDVRRLYEVEGYGMKKIAQQLKTTFYKVRQIVQKNGLEKPK